MNPQPGRRPAVWLPAMNLAIILTIGVIDMMTPDATVAILLALPILASSASDDPRFPWLNFFVALAVFWNGVAQEPPSDSAAWLPNLVLTLSTLPASLILALALQRLRLQSETAREEALRSRDLNRLLVSLLAHDLRAPLGVALQALEYVDETVGEGGPIDERLIADVRARLGRSLGSVDHILSFVRETGPTAATEPTTGAELAAQLAAEASAFAEEAQARGKHLRIEIESDDENPYDVDLLVAREVVAILVDNAVRHSNPGEIGVEGTIAEGELQVSVSDQGPGLSAERPRGASEGAGLGLRLCRALVARAQGHLDVVREGPDGTEFLLRLPLRRTRRKSSGRGRVASSEAATPNVPRLPE